MSGRPHARLLRAAAELFARDGYAGTSVRDIALRAGANVAAVSYHFGGKDQLYAAAVALACEELEAAASVSVGRLRDRIAGEWWVRLLAHELLLPGTGVGEVLAAMRRAGCAPPNRSSNAGSAADLIAAALVPEPELKANSGAT